MCSCGRKKIKTTKHETRYFEYTFQSIVGNEFRLGKLCKTVKIQCKQLREII